MNRRISRAEDEARKDRLMAYGKAMSWPSFKVNPLSGRSVTTWTAGARGEGAPVRQCDAQRVCDDNGADSLTVQMPDGAITGEVTGAHLDPSGKRSHVEFVVCDIPYRYWLWDGRLEPLEPRS